jgi:hypothetical protein
MSSVYGIVHNAQCSLVNVCWIDVNEMCTAEKLSPDTYIYFTFHKSKIHGHETGHNKNTQK